MPSPARLKKLAGALLPALAIACAIPTAVASAHGSGGDGSGGSWNHGYWNNYAAVAGTITSVGTGSFGANAYVVTPGPGNSSAAPSATAATIQIGSTTRVVTGGQSGIAVNDDFYAVYEGVPADTPLPTLEADTPSVIYAFPAPTPEVEVKGVVTTAPASGSDSFTATAYVVTPGHFFPDGTGGGGHGWGGGNWGGDSGNGGTDDSQTRTTRTRAVRSLPGSTPVNDGTPGAVITTDSTTQIRIDGQPSPVSDLAVGDYFTAVYDGMPDESLSTITSTPALAVSVWAPTSGRSLYAFVGTVSSSDTTAGTITVNVTNSIPNGLFSGTDTFDVGSQTIVLGNSGSTLFGSLGNVSTGDVVAGGLLAPSGEAASTVESTPLQVLVDFPQSTSTSSANAQTASIRRAERRALKLLRREQDKHGHHKKK